MKYIAALDQGTTSSRAILFDETGAIVASHAIEFRQIYPQPGWVEHDPMDILQSQTDSLRIAVEESGIDAKNIVAVGITNQRETTLLWEKATGKPLYNAIVWQCRRTASIVEQLKKDGYSDMIRAKTGLIPDAYFSGSKLKWLLDTIPNARERAKNGELCFGTVDSFLAYNLSQEHSHVTDATNAARTMLFNIHTQQWDEELLEMLDIPRELLPEVVDSSKAIGHLRQDILGVSIPIAGMAGDQHAALFGQGCFESGMVKNTYGTGCFMLMNTGAEPVLSKNNLITTVAWRLNGKPTYALEGSVFVAGAAIQWLRDELGIIKTAAETEEMALSVSDNGGVYLVPAFTGLGAPHWDMYARGTLVGLTRGTGRAHIARAALESIALQSADVLQCMVKDSNLMPPVMRVDGGASRNNFLMQFQADMLATKVVRPRITETTALGAAMLAGLAVGLWTMPELAGIWKEQCCFAPCMEDNQRQKINTQWQKAIERAKSWAE